MPSCAPLSATTLSLADATSGRAAFSKRKCDQPCATIPRMAYVRNGVVFGTSASERPLLKHLPSFSAVRLCAANHLSGPNAETPCKRKRRRTFVGAAYSFAESVCDVRRTGRPVRGGAGLHRQGRSLRSSLPRSPAPARGRG